LTSVGDFVSEHHDEGRTNMLLIAT